MKPTYLMLLWHMHQPFYKDLAENIYTMPWVRLHALKDYYGMVAMLREFPSVHVTFNLVPSLLVQLEDYAADRAREEPYRIAFQPVETLTHEDREKLLTFAFQLNRENLLSRYPRFQELFAKAHGSLTRGASARIFTEQDFLDLQVLSQLAWFDEIYLASDREIRMLVQKERAYDEDDKSLLKSKEIELFKATLEEYKLASQRGQIEISTTPFYHPILPLLCDSAIAAESNPGVRLPERRFRHPEDARDQLRHAVVLHERLFGKRPQGLWPSEGSVSDEVLHLAAEEGFRWTATDEGVLGRSLQIGFYRQADGTVSGGHELYRPHRFAAPGHEIDIFFRDHQISDLIGFVYSRMDPEAAAADLHHRIRAVARSTGGRPAVVSVILDGENAWEFFPRNGRDFLRSFYRRVANDPDLKAVTASEALEVTEHGRLTHIVPGSWINANFDVWIGAEEDNRAWDLLSEARDFFAKHSRRSGLEPEKVALAQEELWIAEGSDWCWWYGPEHSSAHDAEFDLLYRKHLSNIYRLLASSPPDALAEPIKKPRAKVVHAPPTGRITPHIDGQVTNYFEWLGAGVYSPEVYSGSMHGAERYFDAFYYGYSAQALYLRLDLHETFLSQHDSFAIRVNVNGESRARLHFVVQQGRVGSIEFWRRDEPVLVPLSTGEQIQVAFRQVVEIQLGYDVLGLTPHDQVCLQLSLWVNGLPLQVIPQEGWLYLELTDDLVSW